MSYSFRVCEASKALALEKIEEELGKIVQAQPVHCGDQGTVLAAAKGLVNLLRQDDTRDVSADIFGSLWHPIAGAEQVSVNITVQLTKRTAS